MTAHRQLTSQHRTRKRHDLQPLTLTGARILAAHQNGILTGQNT
jgi:hypothetical protein